MPSLDLEIWDDELELMALVRGIHCTEEKVACMKTRRFPLPGMNFGTVPSSAVLPAVHTVMELWFRRNIYVTKFEWMNSFGTDQNAPWSDISPFTHMVSDKAVAVGCSIFKYRLQNHMVCVYRSGNDVRGAPVYLIGPMASNCLKINPKYPGLCSAPKFHFSNMTMEIPLFSESPVVKKWVREGKKIIKITNGKTYRKPVH